MDVRSKEERDAAEKHALEAAFEQAMKVQGHPAPAPPQKLPTEDERQQLRVFSFTGAAADQNGVAGQGAAQPPTLSAPKAQEVDEVDVASPAFGRPMTQPATAPSMPTSMTQPMAHPKAAMPMMQWPTSASTSMSMRPGSASRGSVEDRLQHMEDLMIRLHDMQVRQQHEMQAGLGRMFQEATHAMIPELVEHMIERLAQTMDFSELRDQLIESFSASTDLLPVVEERSEAILTSIQEEAKVRKSIFSDVSRMGNKVDSVVTTVNELAGNAVPYLQDIFLDRFDELQRYVELTMTNMAMDFPRPAPQSTGGYDMSLKDAAWQARSAMNRSPPAAADQKGPKLPTSQRQRAPDEVPAARATTLPLTAETKPRRPETAPGPADRGRRHPSQSLTHGPGSAGPRMVSSAGRSAMNGDGRHSARGATSMSDWPWQPRPATPPPQEEEEVVIPAPLPAPPPRARPSDLWGGRG